MKMPLVYADNAATSFPKPPGVGKVMTDTLESIALSPGRSAHRYSLDAGRIIFQARERLADLFNCSDSSRIIFTANVTESLNVGIMGLFPHILKPSDHVIVTRLEHNSVMRPLRFLEQSAGIEVSFLPLNSDGEVDATALPALMRDTTRLLVVNHVSNVTGAIAPLAEIGANKGDALLMVDAAQSAGVLPIDVDIMNIDFLAFTGHKALFGPTGTGGFYVREGLDVHPLKRGGTGSNSEREAQPFFVPDRYESGTLNTLGIAGLDAGIEFIFENGIGAIFSHEQQLTRHFLEGLADIKGVHVYGPSIARERAAVVSLRVDGENESEVAHRLDREFGIMVRAGLHCAPAAHRSIGTFPEGTVRFSFGFFNTEDDVGRCLAAMKTIVAR